MYIHVVFHFYLSIFVSSLAYPVLVNVDYLITFLNFVNLIDAFTPCSGMFHLFDGNQHCGGEETFLYVTVDAVTCSMYMLVSVACVCIN